MPTEVLATVQAQHVRKGDQILGHAVTERKLGRKYAHLTFEHGPTHRYGLTHELPVTRLEKSEEEKSAEIRESVLRMLDSKEGLDRGRHAAAASAVAADVNAGLFPNWSALESLAMLVERVRIWDQFTYRHQRAALAYVDHPDWARAFVEEQAPSRLGVLAELVEYELDQLLGESRLNGSSSPASNFEADGRRAGRGSWLQEIRPLAKAVVQ